LQCGDELPVVDLVIARTENTRRDVRRQELFAPPRFDSRQPLDIQAETYLQVVGEPQRFGIVPRQSHDHRAVFAIVDGHAAGRLQLGGEAGPDFLRLQIEVEQRFLAGFNFGPRGQHTGRGPTRGLARFGPVKDIDPASGRGQTPSDAKTADAGADDGDARFRSVARSAASGCRQGRLPSLA
jgi:hypothetical protein